MFMKTIAVGPLEEVADCVTGGTIVAMARCWRRHGGSLQARVAERAILGKEDALLNCSRNGLRNAISKNCKDPCRVNLKSDSGPAFRA